MTIDSGRRSIDPGRSRDAVRSPLLFDRPDPNGEARQEVYVIGIDLHRGPKPATRSAMVIPSGRLLAWLAAMRQAKQRRSMSTSPATTIARQDPA
jgi:hypothetical protein